MIPTRQLGNPIIDAIRRRAFYTSKQWMFVCLAQFIGVALVAQDVPLHPYYNSCEIKQQLGEGRLSPSQAAQEFSFINQHREALSFPLRNVLALPIDSNWQKQQIDVRPALDYILEEAQRTNVVIINEAHHKPEHRVFTTRLLEQLYGQGYRYLALEALTNHFEDDSKMRFDEQLVQRGYPLNSLFTGTYVREPQMGQLIRRAIELGYELVAYEKTGSGDREAVQAENIYRKIFQQDPTAKAVIHCGYFHVFEETYQGKKWMATHLKERLSIDPLTIYQDFWVEDYFQTAFLYDQFDLSDVSVLVSAEQKEALLSTSFCDLFLFHPATRYRANRPIWLYHDEKQEIVMKSYLAEQQDQLIFPLLIRAFLQEEGASASPRDLIELSSPEDPTPLLLKPGNYLICLGKTCDLKVEVTVE